MKKMLKSTDEIVLTADYISGSEKFFANFANAFEAVRCQVIKLETRDYYDEAGNESFDQLKSGNFSEAAALVEQSKVAEKADYDDLSERSVEFVRCRPVKMPLNEYLKWEFLNYDVCASYGERIFLINSIATGNLFTSYARHDFMVFDARFAFVHDYDQDGRVQGGWVIKNQEDINSLIGLFSLIKANSISFHAAYPEGFSAELKKDVEN